MWLATIRDEGDLIEARRTIAEYRLFGLGEIELETQTWIGLERVEGDTCIDTDNGALDYYDNGCSIYSDPDNSELDCG